MSIALNDARPPDHAPPGAMVRLGRARNDGQERRAASTRKNCHTQGSLDGLCGMYSIVNALTLMLGEDEFEAQVLFRLMARSLGINLAMHLVCGFYTSKLMGLLKVAATFLGKSNRVMTAQRAFRFEPYRLSEYWDRLRDHHAKNGRGSIIIGMSGAYDHWTCVNKITATRLILADSGVLRTIHRKECTIVKPTSVRRFALEPKSTILLSIQ